MCLDMFYSIFSHLPKMYVVEWFSVIYSILIMFYFINDQFYFWKMNWEIGNYNWHKEIDEKIFL
jgi:hypothetical protein